MSFLFSVLCSMFLYVLCFSMFYVCFLFYHYAFNIFYFRCLSTFYVFLEWHLYYYIYISYDFSIFYILCFYKFFAFRFSYFKLFHVFSMFCIFLFSILHSIWHTPSTINHIKLLSKLWRIQLLESNRLCCSIDLLWFKLRQFIKICPLLACVAGPGGDFHMSSFVFLFLAFLFLFFLISLKRFMTAKDTVENSNVCAYSSFNAHKGRARVVRSEWSNGDQKDTKSNSSTNRLWGRLLLLLLEAFHLFSFASILRTFLLPTLRRSRRR